MKYAWQVRLVYRVRGRAEDFPVTLHEPKAPEARTNNIFHCFTVVAGCEIRHD